MTVVIETVPATTPNHRPWYRLRLTGVLMDGQTAGETRTIDTGAALPQSPDPTPSTTET